MPAKRLHELCTVEGCGLPHKSRGYCNAHYQRFKRGVPIEGAFRIRNSNPPETCTEEGCEEPSKSRGLCAMHYARLLRHGHTKHRDRKKPVKHCSEPGCGNILYARGVCHVHYMRDKTLAEFGITKERFAEILAEQGGVCAICKRPETAKDGLSGKPRALAVDHCHDHGHVRGLLCTGCNRALGFFKNDPARLQAAIEYLKRTAQPPS